MSTFEAFDVTDVVYKTVGKTKIEASVLVPKTIPRGVPRPIIIRWHGGFWITGSRLFPDHFFDWLLAFANEHSAVIISPDYRLLPESTGTDMLSDIASLMQWLPGNLEQHLALSNVRPDLSSVLVDGESAGGWCSVQAALLHGSGIAGFPSDESPVKILACISAYGVLDVKIPFFTQSFTKSIRGAPMVASDVLDKHLDAVKAGLLPPVCVGAIPPERRELFLCAVQHGKMVQLMGPEDENYPLEVLCRVKNVPAFWCYHGQDDSAVPWQCSQAFVDKLRETHTEAQSKLTLVPGEHGLDKDMAFDADWLGDGLRWLTTFWPSKGKEIC